MGLLRLLSTATAATTLQSSLRRPLPPFIRRLDPAKFPIRPFNSPSSLDPPTATTLSDHPDPPATTPSHAESARTLQHSCGRKSSAYRIPASSTNPFTNADGSSPRHSTLHQDALFPAQYIPLSRLRNANPSKSPELRALANGYINVTQQQNVRQFWFCFEGKGKFESMQHVEQLLQLNHPECNARVLEFASFLSPSLHAILIDPMRLFLWIGDRMRKTDPNIDIFLGVALFPEQWDVFEAPDPIWTIRNNRIAKDLDKRHSSKGRSALDSEHRARVSSIRQVVDQGIQCMAEKLMHESTANPESKDPVIILDHTGVFSASQYGLDIFEMVTSALTSRLLPMFPDSRIIYNQTAPSAAIAEENLAVMQQESEDDSPVFMNAGTGVAMIKLDPVPCTGHVPSKYATEVFRIMWQKQYLAAKLDLFATSVVDRPVPKQYLENALQTITPALGSNAVEATDLDLLATAIMGLHYNYIDNEQVVSDSILTIAWNLFGWWMSTPNTQKRLNAALEKDAAITHRLGSMDDYEHHQSRPSKSSSSEIFSSSPPSSAHQSIPFINPESITVTMDDVIGQERAKKALDALISLPLRFPKQFSSGILNEASAVGVLLYGPPGTGKTMLAKAIAKSAGATFISICPSDVQDKYVGDSEKFIKKLFEFARQKTKCVIFLDEVDTLFSKRDFDITGWRRDILNEFCMQWDGMKSSRNVIVVGATNRPYDLDEAVIRRFSRRVMVDLPSLSEKQALLGKLLENEMLESAGLIESFLLPKLGSYSASDIKNVCISAAMTAVLESPEAARVLSERHFTVALNEVKPSVCNSAESVVKLRQFASSFEQPNRQLGFISQP